MSKLPQRRKSAEELEALRDGLAEKEGRPAPPVEKKEPPEEEGSVFEATGAGELPVPEAKPVRTLRKGERLAVDQPKERVAENSGKLPVRRHTDRELTRLKNGEPAPAAPPAQYLASMEVGRLKIGLIYGIPALLLLVVFLGNFARGMARYELPKGFLGEIIAAGNFPMVLFGLLAAACLLMFAAAAWIRFRRPRSQHHAGILTVIGVLVLVFGFVYFFHSKLNGA